MPQSPPAVDDLIHDLGSLIAARRALKISDEATSAAVAKAVHDAGLAVSRTIGHPGDAERVRAAREAIAFGEQLMGLLGQEIARSREVGAQALLLRERAAQFLLESVSRRDGRQRRRED